MKTLGLIGGTTWVSTVDYYSYINKMAAERLGGSASAELILYSVNFAEIKAWADESNWKAIGERLSDLAARLESVGAEAIVLCANTMHIVAETVQESIGIPVLHVVDAVAKEIEKQNGKKVALLGTGFTMDNDFYQNRLLTFGIETIVPEKQDRDFIHNSIFDELGKEIFRDETKQRYLEIIDRLSKEGAEGIILGCTEIPLLIKQDDCSVPVFDTTMIHAKYAVDFALA
ncbi:MAG TPA: aspartate/glutamate racemase family protein [Pyrinomonadaceae bacterium]|jgi:aspartate racemase|nr:aspartate/glutamate racemase family protein [Pyrinomonadaceae bacterium]